MLKRTFNSKQLLKFPHPLNRRTISAYEWRERIKSRIGSRWVKRSL